MAMIAVTLSSRTSFPWVRLLTTGLLLCLSAPAGRLSAGESKPTPATASASRTAEVRATAQRLSQAADSLAVETSRDSQAEEHLLHELWSSRVAAPDPNEDAQARLALKHLIRQVRSMTFPGEKASAGSLSVPQLPPVPEVIRPAPGSRQESKAADQPAGAAALAETDSSFSPRARQALESLLKHPDRVRDPLELAELLFLSGRPTEAILFYGQALERTGAGDAATGPDRAWILFQLANCLRETNLAQAQEKYAQLISEFPDSPWTDLAQAQSQLVNWYQNDRPQQLVASRPQP
jgi:tetratricopeptide (TPR) repeat protein